MIHKTFAPDEGKILVTFELPGCIWTVQVYLVGDFNLWNPTAHPMRQKKGGTWTITLELDENRSYEFRYLLDNNEWMNDDHADDYVLYPHGMVHSMVTCSPSHTPLVSNQNVGELLTRTDSTQLLPRVPLAASHEP